MSYEDYLYDTYKFSKSVTLSQGGERDMHVSFEAEDVAISVVINFEGAPEICPIACVTSPVFDFNGSYPVRASGLIVTRGLTPATWKGDDPVSIIVKALGNNVPRVINNTKYKTSVLKSDIDMLYTELPEGFSFRQVQATVDHRLKECQVSLMSDERHVLLVSSLGLKTVCSVVNERMNGIGISSHVQKNLLGDTNLEYAGIIVDEAESVTLHSLLGGKGSVRSTGDLVNYEVVTSGDVLELAGSKYVVVDASPSQSVLLTSSDPQRKTVEVNYA